ncbi:MAG: hypothetical protein R3C56_23010 [Pirellulaceae bacterium]
MINVCVMSFSEFGRRVAENASEGTDHGLQQDRCLSAGARLLLASSASHRA